MPDRKEEPNGLQAGERENGVWGEPHRILFASLSIMQMAFYAIQARWRTVEKSEMEDCNDGRPNERFRSASATSKPRLEA